MRASFVAACLVGIVLVLGSSAAWAQEGEGEEPAPEAGESDAGESDAGEADAGEADAGEADAGEAGPAGSDPAKPQPTATAPVERSTPQADPPLLGGEPSTAAASADPASSAPATVPSAPPPASEVFAEDWWRLSRPVVELHGYFRVRSEFFHNFSLGRKDGVKPLWPQPPDKDYVDTSGIPHKVELCGDDPESLEACDNNTQAGANMRFRLNPELHISDNLRIRAQIDMLDNIVLGSTPAGYANQPSDEGAYRVVARGGYSPTGAFVTTQWSPSAGVNSLKDSIAVKRAWGEYSTPIGQLRFGRMPSHWGLGMLVNSGDGYDSDWQSTADRLMFITGVEPWDLYFALAWDFANEGAISAALNEQQGQPYDLAQQDDVDQWVFVVTRKRNKALARRDLLAGKAVFNGGAYVVYRQQTIANDVTGTADSASLGQASSNVSAGYQRRGAEAVIPDVWFQFLYDKFRFEMEAAMIYGSLESTLRSAGSGVNFENPDGSGDDGWNIRQFGLAFESDYRAIEDRLRIGFGFGYSSGDDDVASLAPIGSELQPQLTADRTYSTFRFHPDYRVDLILFRNVLSRVQGAYYFRPSVEYDFFRDSDGQKLGGGAAVVWSRASEFVQTPGHARDLGIELDFKLRFQAKDGALNDDPDKIGGFYTQLEYGVLFPLGGLGYLPGQVADYATLQPNAEPLDTETAQTVRWYLGILF